MSPIPNPLNGKGKRHCPPRIRTWTKGSKDPESGDSQSKRPEEGLGRKVGARGNAEHPASLASPPNLHANIHERSAHLERLRAELRSIYYETNYDTPALPVQASQE